MILPILAQVTDGRRGEGRRYDLPHILLFTILAILAGANSYRDIAVYISKHFKVLKQIFKPKWKCPPDYSTIRRAILQADTNSLEGAVRKHARMVVQQPKKEKTKDKLIATDGKTLKGSFDHGKGQAQLQLLSVYG